MGSPPHKNSTSDSLLSYSACSSAAKTNVTSLSKSGKNRSNKNSKKRRNIASDNKKPSNQMNMNVDAMPWIANTDDSFGVKCADHFETSMNMV